MSLEFISSLPYRSVDRWPCGVVPQSGPRRTCFREEGFTGTSSLTSGLGSKFSRRAMMKVTSLPVAEVCRHTFFFPFTFLIFLSLFSFPSRRSENSFCFSHRPAAASFCWRNCRGGTWQGEKIIHSAVNCAATINTQDLVQGGVIWSQVSE